MIHSRVSWMCLPVDRSITVSPPQRIAHTSFSTSSAMPEETALLPMLALILVRKLRPMIIGSLSGWLMLFGRMARPRAISSRTNSGVMTFGMLAPKASPGCCFSSVRIAHRVQPLVLADGDVFHLRRDDAAPGVMHLADVGAGLGTARQHAIGEAHGIQLRIVLTRAAEGRAESFQRLRIAALLDPLRAQRRRGPRPDRCALPDRYRGRTCRTR